MKNYDLEQLCTVDYPSVITVVEGVAVTLPVSNQSLTKENYSLTEVFSLDDQSEVISDQFENLKLQDQGLLISKLKSGVYQLNLLGKESHSQVIIRVVQGS